MNEYRYWIYKDFQNKQHRNAGIILTKYDSSGADGIHVPKERIFHTLEEAEEYVNHPSNNNAKLIIVKKPYGMIYHRKDDDHKYFSIDDDRYEDDSFFDQEHYDFDTLDDYIRYVIEWNGLFASCENHLENIRAWARGDKRIYEERIGHMLRIVANKQWRLKYGE
jgi:hypothetical protein